MKVSVTEYTIGNYSIGWKILTYIDVVLEHFSLSLFVR